MKGKPEINKGCTVRFNEVVKLYPQINYSKEISHLM
jgi:hypothetical protein